MVDWNLNVNLNRILDAEHEFNEYFLKYMILLTRMNIFFEHELNELNEFFIKTCDSKNIRVIRIIRVQKIISGLYILGVVL